MEEVWTLVQYHGTHSMPKTGLKRPLKQQILDKLDECEERISKLLIDLATDESETKSLIKITPQESNEEVV